MHAASGRRGVEGLRIAAPDHPPLVNDNVSFRKSANHFYAAYAPFAAKVLFVDSPGGASTNWKELKYRHRPRNLWPMDN